MDSSKKKPVKLNVEIVLKEGPSPCEPSGNERTRAAKASKTENAQKLLVQPPLPGYDFRARFEKKGRGGQPVFVLYAFHHESLLQKAKLDVKALAKLLKEKLSCGGTVHNDRVEEIILQFRDRERLEGVLSKLGLKMQMSGGA